MKCQTILKGREHRLYDYDENGEYQKNESGLYLDINIRNANQAFQIIKNDKSFTLEGCWAGIGGFIGIFIGISLRQIPHLVTQFFRFIEKIVK